MIVIYSKAGNPRYGSTSRGVNPTYKVVEDAEFIVPVTTGATQKQYSEKYAQDISKNLISDGYVYNEQAINNSLENILLTLTGERIFNVGFGSILPAQTFSQVSFSQAETLLTELVNVIGFWENRINVVESEIEMIIDKHKNSVILVIPYVISRNGMTGTFSRKINL